MFDSKKSQNKFINDLNAIKLPEINKVLPAEAFISKSKKSTSNFNRKKLYPIIPFGIAIILFSSVLILQIGLPNLSGLITDENPSVDSNSKTSMSIIESECLLDSENQQFSSDDIILNGKSKFAGSDFSIIKTPSIDWLVENSDLIIIGNVLDNGELIQAEGPHFIDSETNIKIFQFPFIRNSVSIEKILFGNENSKEIIFAQLALADYDCLQTKLYKGDRVILFLINKEDNIYIPVTFQDACFKITNGDIIYSFSNEKVVAKYNGEKVEVLIEDIENIVKK